MIKKHTISFQNAFNGLIWALKTQPNFKIHLFFSFLALSGGLFLNATYSEFLIIIVLICIGLVIETINTSIEATTDAIDRKWRDDIKIAKDLSAAAMLIFSIGAVIIAAFIFVPKLIVLLKL